MKLTFNKLFASAVATTALVGSVEGTKDSTEDLFVRNLRSTALKFQPKADIHVKQRRLPLSCSGIGVAQGGGITVDGATGDWDLTADFLIDMCEAGNCDKANPVLASKAYARYDCDTETLCLLVLAEPAFELFSVTTGQSWFKDYDLSNSVQTPLAQVDVTNTDGVVVGWEGCYSHTPTCVADAEIHANFKTLGSSEAGRTTSTGKPNGSGTISMDLTCGCTTASDCSSSDGCLSVDCVNQQCEPTAIDGCECDSDDDCATDVDCKIGVCVQSDPMDPSTWKCQEQDDPDPTCGNTGCTTSQDCFDANPGESEICAEATCKADGSCAFSAKPGTDGSTPCGDGNYVPADDCDLGFFCDGKDCTQKYKANNDGCNDYDIPSGGSSECYTGKCLYASGDSGPTVCTPEPLPDVSTKCGEDRGDCDQGDWCVAGVCETNHFEPTTTICRPSAGCCDAIDYCTGDSFDCSADAKIDGSTCRPTCPVGGVDPAEVCDGVNNDCPEDVILDDTLCLMAGQSNPAGTVSLTAEPTLLGYDLCATISLDGWQLDEGESIKAEFSTGEAPGSAPGQYSYKYPGDITETAAGTYELCLFYSLGELCPADGSILRVYFAIHLDVNTGPGTDSETAWALPCVDSDLTGNRFLNKNPKKGGYEGWGQYFVWKASCPTNCPLDCPGCEDPTDPTSGDQCPTQPPTCSTEADCCPPVEGCDMYTCMDNGVDCTTEGCEATCSCVDGVATAVVTDDETNTCPGAARRLSFF